MTVSPTFNNRYIVVNSTQIARFSSNTFTTGRSFQKMVIEQDRKHYADVKCEKQHFPNTLPMIFDRLSRHLGFSNLAWIFKFGMPFQASQQSRSPISMETSYNCIFVTFRHLGRAMFSVACVPSPLHRCVHRDYKRIERAFRSKSWDKLKHLMGAKSRSDWLTSHSPDQK